MIVKTDDKKRVVLPNAKPGDVFKVESSIEGIITLTKLVPAEPSWLIHGRSMAVGWELRRPVRTANPSWTPSARIADRGVVCETPPLRSSLKC
jgi:hypothetical protein